MSGFGIQEIVDSLLRDYDETVARVLLRASKQAKTEVNKFATKSVEHYYNYSPQMYDRTGALYDSFIAFNFTSGNKLDVGVAFSGARLNGRHMSNSKYHQYGGAWVSWHERERGKKYADGIVEGQYVIDKFWKGEHPRYKWNGNGYSDVSKKDKKTPDQWLTEYMQEYVDGELTQYITNEMFNEMLKQIR